MPASPNASCSTMTSLRCTNDWNDSTAQRQKVRGTFRIISFRSRHSNSFFRSSMNLIYWHDRQHLTRKYEIVCRKMKFIEEGKKECEGVDSERSSRN